MSSIDSALYHKDEYVLHTQPISHMKFNMVSRNDRAAQPILSLHCLNKEFSGDNHREVILSDFCMSFYMVRHAITL